MITKIDVEGGSGNIPSGPMQFKNDWCGVFLRGDDLIEIFWFDEFGELPRKIYDDLPDADEVTHLTNLSGRADKLFPDPVTFDPWPIFDNPEMMDIFSQVTDMNPHTIYFWDKKELRRRFPTESLLKFYEAIAI